MHIGIYTLLSMSCHKRKHDEHWENLRTFLSIRLASKNHRCPQMTINVRKFLFKSSQIVSDFFISLNSGEVFHNFIMFSLGLFIADVCDIFVCKTSSYTMWFKYEGIIWGALQCHDLFLILRSSIFKVYHSGQFAKYKLHFVSILT